MKSGERETDCRVSELPPTGFDIPYEALIETQNTNGFRKSIVHRSDAIKRSVATDIPLDRLPDLIDLATIVDTDEAVGIGFTPPTYTTGRSAEGYPLPNVDLIREHVAIVMELPAAEAIEVLGLEPLADVCG